MKNPVDEEQHIAKLDGLSLRKTDLYVILKMEKKRRRDYQNLFDQKSR